MERYRDPLTVEEIRNLNEGDYIIVDLDDECYWQQGEGEVEYVTTYDDGRVHVGIKYASKLKVPADGRRKMRFNGRATGATNLEVTNVYER